MKKSGEPFRKRILAAADELKSPRMGYTSDDQVSLDAGIGRNTVSRARQATVNTTEKSAEAVEALLQKKKREVAGYGAESPADMRRIAEGWIRSMSDLAIAEVFDTLGRAQLADMQARYAPPADTDDQEPPAPLGLVGRGPDENPPSTTPQRNRRAAKSGPKKPETEDDS